MTIQEAQEQIKSTSFVENADIFHKQSFKDRDWDANPVYKIDENEGKKLIEAIEAVNKWIPVSERLPEKSGFYLVSTTDCITIMEFSNGWISQNIGSCNWYVKAWMPLPQPYKAESEV